MKKSISNQDIELICSMLVPGRFKLDIDLTFEKEQRVSGDLMGDINKPSSLVLVTDRYLQDFENKYDFIIDFSNKTFVFDRYNKAEFKIKFNKDGSIHYLFEENKKEKFWGLNFFKNNEKTIRVFYKNPIFFKKQIENLPCDNYWVNFGNSANLRKIDVALYANNYHLLNLKIAYNDDTTAAISKQKYFMSKLSFYDFETIDLPNECFSKNSKLLINSLVLSEKKLKNHKKIFPLYLNEIFNKTARIERVEKSKFFLDTLEEIRNFACPNTREILLQFSCNIDLNEKFFFGLSLGKLDQLKGGKYVCSDFSVSSLNMPILSDFFYQFIKELTLIQLKNKNQLLSYLAKKVQEYKIHNFIQENNLLIENYFYLFMLNYIVKNPAKQNVEFLAKISYSLNKLNLAC